MSFSSTTLIERVRLAKSYVDLYNSEPNGFWVALGRSQPWPNESMPPLPLSTSSKVPGAFLFVYVHSCLSVYDNENGSIVTEDRNLSYSLETDLNSLTSLKANKVYFEALINKDFSSTPFSYRVSGLCFNVVTTNPINNLGPGYTLQPNQVESYYTSWIKTSPPINVSPSSSKVIQLVREF
jgi:hypothetical protein